MRAAILLLACAGGALAFAPQASRSARRSAPLRGKAPKSEDGADAPQRIAEGTVCEWVAEKHRVHVGVVKSSESKSKGGARYEIADASGVVHTVPEKQLSFVGKVVQPKDVAKTLTSFDMALSEDTAALRTALKIDADLLALAWETAAEEDAGELSEDDVAEQVLGHKTSNLIEKYRLWRLLTSDLGRFFFKELKHNGRVDTWKAKAVKSVEAAKKSFCDNHNEPEFCFA